MRAHAPGIQRRVITLAKIFFDSPFGYPTESGARQVTVVINRHRLKPAALFEGKTLLEYAHRPRTKDYRMQVAHFRSVYIDMSASVIFQRE